MTATAAVLFPDSISTGKAPGIPGFQEHSGGSRLTLALPCSKERERESVCVCVWEEREGCRRMQAHMIEQHWASLSIHLHVLFSMR